jgi:hypothetical protein
LHNVDIVPLYISCPAIFPTLTVSKHCRLCAFAPSNSSPSRGPYSFFLLAFIFLTLSNWFM